MKQGEGYVIFCEDIRRDVNDMNSLIGIFPGEITFKKPFPNTMPKLGLMICMYVDVDNPPKSFSISLEASWDIEPLAELNIEFEADDSEMSSFLKYYPRDELSQFEGRVRLATINSVIPLFEVEDKGMLRVISTVNGERFLLGRKYVHTLWTPGEDETPDLMELSTA